MDNTAGTPRLQDDFYEFVAADILPHIVKDPTSPQWSQFHRLSYDTRDKLNEIALEIAGSDTTYPKGSPQQKIKDLYEQVLASYKTPVFDAFPIQKQLDAILNAETVAEYQTAVFRTSRELILPNPVFFCEPDNDMNDSSRMTIGLNRAGALIGKAYLEDPKAADMCRLYFDYVKDCFVLYGRTPEEAEADTAAVEELARKIAAVSLTNAEYHKVTNWKVSEIEQLEKTYPNLHIREALETYGMAEMTHVNVYDEGNLAGINALMTEENLSAFKRYSLFCILTSLSGCLGAPLHDRTVRYGNESTGVKETKTPEKQALDTVRERLDWEFGRIYVERYFSERAKQDVQEMIADIVGQYRKVLNKQDWMSEATRAHALVKLDALGARKIGYPDDWAKYCSRVTVLPAAEGGNWFVNRTAMAQAGWERDMERLHRPKDKTEWAMPPQTVNAYYSPSDNEIVFPAGIMQPPFYDEKASRAENLGGIGFVIAHEITHAFDANGSLYDEHGNLSSWWTEEDRTAYDKLCERIVAAFDKYELVGGHVDGRLTLGENIADLGAANCVSGLLKGDREGLRAAFLRQATCWVYDYTTEYRRRLLKNDPHSPNKIRVNGVLTNTDGFYTAYSVREGDGMYTAPENRVGIWK